MVDTLMYWFNLYLTPLSHYYVKASSSSAGPQPFELLIKSAWEQVSDIHAQKASVSPRGALKWDLYPSFLPQPCSSSSHGFGNVVRAQCRRSHDSWFSWGEECNSSRCSLKKTVNPGRPDCLRLPLSSAVITGRVTGSFTSLTLNMLLLD